ncbi:hypothetical protein OESDEN_03363 [Oesophagostomum dentatum]|uniref:Uncharacterized protein n=1 Tax=Oesophagostomum dentatum TaxID=61180 RepID=A0A0B1TGM9_OESDE|nr:hypothetical protein OESDEN_03363 [Oesophagostomum dentatum]
MDTNRPLPTIMPLAYHVSSGNIAFGCASLHGIASPLSLVFCNDTYRKFALRKLGFDQVSSKLKLAMERKSKNEVRSDIIRHALKKFCRKY